MARETPWVPCCERASQGVGVWLGQAAQGVSEQAEGCRCAGQVAGHIIEYGPKAHEKGKRLTFATVRGAGHVRPSLCVLEHRPGVRQATHLAAALGRAQGIAQHCCASAACARARQERGGCPGIWLAPAAFNSCSAADGAIHPRGAGIHAFRVVDFTIEHVLMQGMDNIQVTRLRDAGCCFEAVHLLLLTAAALNPTPGKRQHQGAAWQVALMCTFA